MKKLAIAALLGAIACNAAAADTYELDPTHTFPYFELEHLGLSKFTGRFDKTSGTATLDLAKKTGSVEVKIEVDSISTGVDKLDEHLQKDDFFDAKKFPTITFKSTAFKFDGDKLDEVKGELTIHGVTKPVTLEVEHFACKEHPMKKVPACGINLEGTIKRSEFGISTYVPMVGDEVKLRIEAEAAKK